MAAEALQRVGLLKRADTITSILKDEDPTNRMDAIRVLQTTGNGEYIPLLTSAEADPHEVVRSAAVRAVQKIRGGSVV